MKQYTIAAIAGDGIGPEIMREALKVLCAVERKYRYRFDVRELLAGLKAYEVYGDYFPATTIDECRRAEAILLGATGVSNRTGRELILDIRKQFSFFANIRPVMELPRKERDAFNFVIVRELASGIYFGRRKEARYCGLLENVTAEDTASYSVYEIERIARLAFRIASSRAKTLVSVDKANVLATSRLWRKVVDDVAKDYPRVSYSHMLVDNAAMQMIKNPRQFDVVLTENMFGDFLSDEAAGLVGSIGMAPSASFNEDRFGLFEPIHGSAPDIAGKGIANPVGMIRSLAMMLEYSFGLTEESSAIERAIEEVLEEGYGTVDLAPKRVVSTSAFGDLVVKYLKLCKVKSVKLKVKS